MRVILSEEAQSDLEDIYVFGIRSWGRYQANSYREKLIEGLRRLDEYPLLGPERDDIRPGVHSLIVERHRLLYRVSPEHITVLRIVHVRRDPSRHLDDPNN